MKVASNRNFLASILSVLSKGHQGMPSIDGASEWQQPHRSGRTWLAYRKPKQRNDPTKSRRRMVKRSRRQNRYA